MTNFEKWKEGLTAEKIAEKMPGLRDMVCCKNSCPVYGSCTCEQFHSTDCETAFREWANAEAESRG